MEAEIDRLNKAAEDMLTGATVAGLASSYGQTRDNLTEELLKARNGFYVAIGILFISAIPLISFVFPWLGDVVVAGRIEDVSSPTSFLGEVFVRAIVLLPGAWLTKFMAARHAALFRLREQYSHKYSIASSVEGFKKQAEGLEDQIAAGAFFELTSNPADKMERKGRDDQTERHPNPAIEWIMKKLGLTAEGNGS